MALRGGLRYLDLILTMRCAAFAGSVQSYVLRNASQWNLYMTTSLAIELSWYIALGSAALYLSSRRTVVGGLSGIFFVLLGLGLWYGWQGAGYLWAAQWTVYIAGVLFLWAWLALEVPLRPQPRYDRQSLLAVLFLGGWLFLEGSSARGLFSFSFPKPLPDLAAIGLLWAQGWAPLFAWLSVALAGLWLLLATLWPKPPS